MLEFEWWLQIGSKAMATQRNQTKDWQPWFSFVDAQTVEYVYYKK